jgi:hypothetical protein
MRCEHDNVTLIYLEYEMVGESCGIYHCNGFGRLLKIRYQFDPGCGNDHIVLYLGQNERGYIFTVQEFITALIMYRVKMRIKEDKK